MPGMEELPFDSFKEPGIFTVSQLNDLVRELLETNFPDIWVEGEISNFRKYPSGHLYFTLKDETSEINAVMFRQRVAYLEFPPEDGMNVLTRGTVTVYGPRGKYQLEVQRMKPAGLGKLQLAFEKLKEKLKVEGLFDEVHKQPISAFPERVGVVTSTEGAAIRDIVSIIARRYPIVELRVFPVKVQGDGAAEEIAQAIERANRYHLHKEPLDALVVGRGGGSLEDLWAFNEEIVARAIYRSKIPVVSAVGHEVDVTIADFVADLRAPTPSAAAELMTPHRAEIEGRLRETLGRLVDVERSRLVNLATRLQMVTSSYAFRRPLRRLRDDQQRLDHLGEQLQRAFQVRFRSAHERLSALLGRLEAVGPTAVLRRGYAIAEDAQGRAITSAGQVQIGDRVAMRLHRGRLVCEVLEKDDPS